MTAAAAGNRGMVAMALGAALLWGLWWLPVRWLESDGITGVWTGVVMAAGGLPLAMAVWLRPGADRRLGRQALAGAALIGVSVTLYSAALGFTDVVRVVLLFYLAPAWSTLIEVAFLGRRWSGRSALALMLSFAGLLAIFRGDLALSGWSWGDAMALGAGIAWSVGAALIFTAPRRAGAGALTAVTCLGAIVTGLGIRLVAGSAAGDLPASLLPGDGLLAGLLCGIAYMGPVLLVTLVAALSLPPATMSFLLTAEILSGIGSAALLLDEPFGLPEAAGAALVTAGALVEVLRPPPRPSAA